MEKVLSLMRKFWNAFVQWIASSKRMRFLDRRQPEPAAVNESKGDKTNGEASDDAISTLLNSFLHDKAVEDLVLVPRFLQRLAVLDRWSITPESKVLDVGCGQGESALSLALHLGPKARITGIDTASPDYGAPYTVAQSHEYVSQTRLGKQISFLNTDTESLVSNRRHTGAKPIFDAAVLCHILWYFPNTSSIISLFAALASAGVPRLYLAEYDFASTDPTQLPHVLAARAQALLHKYKTPPEVPDPLEQNVRAALDVEDIRNAAREARFEVAREGHVTPAKNMLEGHFEVRYVIKGRFSAAVKRENLSPQHENEILAYVPKAQEAVAKLEKAGVEKVRAMDIWWAELHLSN